MSNYLLIVCTKYTEDKNNNFTAFCNITLWVSSRATTEAWKRGHRYNLRTKRLFMTRSTWQKPEVNATELSENAFTNPVYNTTEHVNTNSHNLHQQEQVSKFNGQAWLKNDKIYPCYLHNIYCTLHSGKVQSVLH